MAKLLEPTTTTNRNNNTINNNNNNKSGGMMVSSCFSFKNVLIFFLCCSQLASLISENHVTKILNSYNMYLTTTTTGENNNDGTTSTGTAIASPRSAALGGVLSSSQRFNYYQQNQKQERQRQHKTPNWMMAVDCASYDQSCTTYHVSHHRYAPYPFDFNSPLKNISAIPKITTLLEKEDTNSQNNHNFPLKHNLDAALDKSQPYTLNKYPPQVSSEAYQECVSLHKLHNYSWQLQHLLTNELTPNSHFEDTIVFTISNYKYAFDMIHAFFQMSWTLLTNHTNSVFIVALDVETMELACRFGYPILYLHDDNPTNTKTLVQSSKFLLSRDIVMSGNNYIFTEMDIWFITDPIPTLRKISEQQEQLNNNEIPPDIMVSGHQDNPWAPNIGFYFVRSNPHTKSFFGELYHILELCPTVFDQFAFQEMWRLSQPGNHEYSSREYNEGSNNRWKEYCSADSAVVPPMPDFGDFTTRNNVVLPGFQAQEWPLIHEHSVAIHPLCGAPLRSPNGKKMVAKELGAWYGFQSTFPRPTTTTTTAVAAVEAEQDQAGYYHRTGTQNRRYLMLDGQAWMGWDFNSPNVYHRNHILQFTITTLVAIARQTDRIFILPKAFHDRLGNFLWTALDLQSLEGVVEFRETNFINNPRSWYDLNQNQPFRNVARTALAPLRGDGGDGDELILFGQPATAIGEGEEESNDQIVQTWRMDRKSVYQQQHPMDYWLHFLTSQSGYNDAELLLVNPHFLHERTHDFFLQHPQTESSPIVQEIIKLHYETIKWCGDVWGRLSEVWPPGRTRASDDCYGEGQLVPRRRRRRRQL